MKNVVKTFKSEGKEYCYFTFDCPSCKGGMPELQPCSRCYGAGYLSWKLTGRLARLEMDARKFMEIALNGAAEKKYYESVAEVTEIDYSGVIEAINTKIAVAASLSCRLRYQLWEQLTGESVPDEEKNFLASVRAKIDALKKRSK